MVIHVIALVAQLATAQPAPPAETPVEGVTVTAPVAPAATTPEPEVRCRNVIPTGSRRPVRVCTTVSQDATVEARSEGRQTMMRNTIGGASPGERPPPR